jgi:uncharacterized protein (DUF1499 family)
MTGTNRLALILGALAALAFALGPLGAFLGILPPMTAFSLFGLGGLLGIITLIVGLIMAVRSGVSGAAPCLVLGGVITAAFLLLALPARNLPRINDITTDREKPPEFVRAPSLPGNEGRDMRYPGESFASQQMAGYPDLKPLQLKDAPAAAFERVERTAREIPHWEVTRSDPSALALEGVATSQLFRFKDDFVIEVRAVDGGSVVQMRSKSRDGRGDVGANAARIEMFFAKLR